MDPTDPTINTQRVERMWRTLKSVISSGCNNKEKESYFAEFLFKHKNNWYLLKAGERIKLLLDVLKNIKFE